MTTSLDSWSDIVFSLKEGTLAILVKRYSEDSMAHFLQRIKYLLEPPAEALLPSRKLHSVTRRTVEPTPVYDIENLRGQENFALANGCIVHNSASGGLRFARFEDFQEFLPLKGKIKNLVSADQNKVKSETSEEVLNLLAMLGVDPKSDDPTGKLRVGKIIVMADADPDGPLVGGTKVKMVDGSVKTMKQLADEWSKDHSPQWVWAVDKHGDLHPAKAYAASIVRKVSTLQQITFDDGTVVTCDYHHAWPVPVHQALNAYKQEHGISFVRAGLLKEGQSVLRSANAPDALVVKREVINLESPEPVYCMAVPGFANFLLEDSNGNGIATGNSHIQTLVFGALFRYVPEVFDRGMVYVTRVPEYYSIVGDHIFSGDSLVEVQELLAKHKVKGTVNHVKGYGEIDSNLLRIFACDPKTRCLFHVKASSFDQFELLMGSDSSARKQLLGL